MRRLVIFHRNMEVLPRLVWGGRNIGRPSRLEIGYMEIHLRNPIAGSMGAFRSDRSPPSVLLGGDPDLGRVYGKAFGITSDFTERYAAFGAPA